MRDVPRFTLVGNLYLKWKLGRETTKQSIMKMRVAAHILVGN